MTYRFSSSSSTGSRFCPRRSGGGAVTDVEPGTKARVFSKLECWSAAASFFRDLNAGLTHRQQARDTLTNHKSHDPCFNKKYMEAEVMPFVGHCTATVIANAEETKFLARYEVFTTIIVLF